MKQSSGKRQAGFLSATAAALLGRNGVCTQELGQNTPQPPGAGAKHPSAPCPANRNSPQSTKTVRGLLSHHGGTSHTSTSTDPTGGRAPTRGGWGSPLPRGRAPACPTWGFAAGKGHEGWDGATPGLHGVRRGDEPGRPTVSPGARPGPPPAPRAAERERGAGQPAPGDSQ